MLENILPRIWNCPKSALENQELNSLNKVQDHALHPYKMARRIILLKVYFFSFERRLD